MYIEDAVGKSPFGRNTNRIPIDFDSRNVYIHTLLLSHLDLNEPPPTEVEEGRLDHVPFAQLGDASDVDLHLAMGGTI